MGLAKASLRPVFFPGTALSNFLIFRLKSSVLLTHLLFYLILVVMDQAFWGKSFPPQLLSFPNDL